MADIVSTTFLLCCCSIPVLFVLFFAGLFITLVIRRGKFAVSDYVSEYSGWVSIITARSIAAIVGASIFMSIALISIEFSLFASIAIFTITLVVIFLLIALIAKIFIHLKIGIFGKQSFVESSISKIELVENSAGTIKVAVKSMIPPGYVLKITEKMPAKLGGDLRGVATKTENGTAIFETTIPHTRRGVYTLGPVHLSYQDMFGLSRINITDSSRVELTILPEIPQITRYSLTLSRSKGDEDQQIVALVNTEDYYATRPYVRGDDVRRLHWKLTAKTGNLVIRQAEVTSVSFHTMNIVIWNVMPKVTIGKGSYATTRFKTPAELALDNQVRIAGAIVDYALRTGIPVTVHYHEKSKMVSFTPQAHDPHEWKYRLAAVSYTYDRPDIEALEKLAANEKAILMTLSETDSSSITQLGSTLTKEGLDSIIYYCPYSEFIDRFALVTPSKESRFMGIIKMLLLTKPYFLQTTLGEKIEKLLLTFQEKYKKEDIAAVEEEEKKAARMLQATGLQVKVLQQPEYATSDADNIIDLLENE